LRSALAALVDDVAGLARLRSQRPGQDGAVRLLVELL
jgi:23S rRNA (adenine2503-C2)-methyltransferase